MSRKLDVRCYKMTPEQLVGYAKETFAMELDPAAKRETLLEILQDHKHSRDQQAKAAADSAKEVRKAKRADAVPSGKNRVAAAKLNQQIAEASQTAKLQEALPPELRQQDEPPTRVVKSYRVGEHQAVSVLTDAAGQPLLPDSDPVLPEELAFMDVTNLVDEDEERKLQEKLAAFPQFKGKVGGLRSQTSSERPFRHPQHVKWFRHPKTGVYWPPTETLMRREDLLPVFEATLPPDAVIGA